MKHFKESIAKHFTVRYRSCLCCLRSHVRLPTCMGSFWVELDNTHSQDNIGDSLSEHSVCKRKVVTNKDQQQHAMLGALVAAHCLAHPSSDLLTHYCCLIHIVSCVCMHACFTCPCLDSMGPRCPGDRPMGNRHMHA